MTNRTIMLADIPPLLRATLENLLTAQPGVTVVRGQTEGGLLAAAAAAKADVVVVAGSDPADLGRIDPALGWAAKLSVLALSLDGRSACVHRLRVETQVLGEVSAEGIRAALVGLAEG